MTAVKNLPPPRGAFSRVKVSQIGDMKLLFVSGTAASKDPQPDAGKQTEVIFETIESLLSDHGASLGDIMKITCFLSDMKNYDKYNSVRDAIFSKYLNPPASSTVEAKLVKSEFLVEVEAIAAVNMSSR